MTTIYKTVDVGEVEVAIDMDDMDDYRDPQMDRRENDYRKDLYRAIYAGDMEKAEDIINMMAMIDIDRDLIWKAKSEVRPTKVEGYAE